MKRRSGIQVGGTSIIMVFVLLCLTIFAVLTLQSARADQRLSQKAAENTALYYQADVQAEEMFAAIHNIAMGSYPSTGPQDYLDVVASRLGELSYPVTLEGNLLRYAVPMGEAQQLEVALILPYPIENNEYLKRVEWVVSSTLLQSEELGDGVILMDPDTFNPAMLG